MWSDNMDMLDELEDLMCEKAFYLNDAINRGVWITNNGDTIPFEKLTDRHLNNIILRGEREGSEAYFGLWDEIKEALYAEQEWRFHHEDIHQRRNHPGSS